MVRLCPGHGGVSVPRSTPDGAPGRRLRRDDGAPRHGSRGQRVDGRGRGSPSGDDLSPGQAHAPGAPDVGHCPRSLRPWGLPRHPCRPDTHGGRLSWNPPALTPDGGEAMIVDLFWRFALISLLAFGAGGTVLPLIE